MATRQVEVAGLRVFVHTPARGDVAETGTTPIVLLHGGPGVPDYLQQVGLELCGRSSRTVITYDQRGSGESVTTEPLSSCFCGAKRLAVEVKSHLADIETIRTHFGAKRIHVAGHSWGGLLGQLYAAEQGESVVASLVLLSSSIGCGSDWKEMEAAVMNYNKKQCGSLTAFGKMGLHSLQGMLPGSLGDAGSQKVMATVWKNYFEKPDTAPAADKTWLLGVKSHAMHQTRNSVVKLDALPQISSNISVLILYGEPGRDIYGEMLPKRVVDRFPAAQTHFVQGSGHLLWIDQPAKFYDLMTSFYSRQAM